MKTRITLGVAVVSCALLAASGFAVTRGQESVGAHVDDTAITTTVKGRYVGNAAVDATRIHVETQNGPVVLSGFAKN